MWWSNANYTWNYSISNGATDITTLYSGVNEQQSGAPSWSSYAVFKFKATSSQVTISCSYPGGTHRVQLVGIA